MKAFAFIATLLSVAVSQGAPTLKVQCTAEVLKNGESVVSTKVDFQLDVTTQEKAVFTYAGATYTFQFRDSAAAGPFDTLTLTREDSKGSTTATSLMDQFSVVALDHRSKNQTTEAVMCLVERQH